MTPQEAMLWATGLKMLTDLIGQSVGRKMTVEDLEEAVKSEEVRSKILEQQRGV